MGQNNLAEFPEPVIGETFQNYYRRLNEYLKDLAKRLEEKL
jgi:hypothetical protein